MTTHTTAVGRQSQSAMIALMLAGSLALSACGGDSPTAGSGDSGGDSVAGSVDLSGVEISVGSKEFTEQLILGAMTVQALEAAGATVDDNTGLVGSPIVRAALESGEVDVYWEYTGTAWLGPLGNTDPIPGEEEQFDAVREADAENGITWTAMAAANNAYAIAVNPEAAEEFDISTISDWAALAEEDPEAATLCSEAEFPIRNDGLPAVEETYGFDLPESNVAVLDYGLVYTSVAAREPCNFAVVFGTDPQVLANELLILEDDKQALAIYNIALSMRTDVYEQNAEAYDTLFGAIAEELTTERATALNAQVDIDGESPDDVAAEFLVEAGIIDG